MEPAACAIRAWGSRGHNESRRRRYTARWAGDVPAGPDGRRVYWPSDAAAASCSAASVPPAIGPIAFSPSFQEPVSYTAAARILFTCGVTGALPARHECDGQWHLLATRGGNVPRSATNDTQCRR